MRRFQALHQSFPFLTRFRLYRVSADPYPGQTLRWPSAGPGPVACGQGTSRPGQPWAHAKGRRLLWPCMPSPCPAACCTRRIFSSVPRDQAQGVKTPEAT